MPTAVLRDRELRGTSHGPGDRNGGAVGRGAYHRANTGHTRAKKPASDIQDGGPVAKSEKGERDADMKTHEVTAEVVEQLVKQDPARYRVVRFNGKLIEVSDCVTGRLWQKTRSGWLLYE